MNKILTKKPFKHSQGFTIVELMIAVTIFAVVMVAVTASVTQIGRIFYKGITTAKTQESTRKVSDQIVQQLKFTSGSVQTVGNVVCIGGNHYHFNLYTNTNPLRYVKVGESVPCDAGSLSAGDPVSILPENTRLQVFSVSCNGGSELCDVNVTVAFGDGSSLDNPNTGAVDPNTPGSLCTGNYLSTQFCAVSGLNTSVVRRVL